MGFLDKVKDAAGKATEQAKQVAAAGKEKIDDARLQKKINDLYEEIGKLIVASKRGNTPPDLDAQIDTKVAEITDIEQQIEANDGAPESGATGVDPPPSTTAPQDVPTAPPGPPSAS